MEQQENMHVYQHQEDLLCKRKVGEDELHQLVKRAKENQPDAFSQLYELVYQDLYRFALYTLRHVQDAQDVVSDAVTDAYYGLSGLKKAEAFRGWIFKILSSKCKKKLRKKYRQEVQLEEHMVWEMNDRGEKLDVQQAFWKLDDEERLIISMSVFAGYTSKEIGKILHKNPNTVRSKQQRALNKMRKWLTADEEDYNEG